MSYWAAGSEGYRPAHSTGGLGQSKVGKLVRYIDLIPWYGPAIAADGIALKQRGAVVLKQTYLFDNEMRTPRMVLHLVVIRIAVLHAVKGGSQAFRVPLS